MKQYRTLKCNDFFEIVSRISSTYKKETEGENSSSVNMCPIVTNYRTFIDDMYKVLEFAEWVKEIGDFALFA